VNESSWCCEIEGMVMAGNGSSIECGEVQMEGVGSSPESAPGELAYQPGEKAGRRLGIRQ
jgi:hypothetical protein